MAPREVGSRREIRGYDAVRAAARDYATYSSDLIGDRHARDYLQLPLEVDPPRHTALRTALQPIFLNSAIEPKVPRFVSAARSLVDDLTNRGGGELVSELALPYVVRCLTIVFNRQQDYDEWLSWGADVFAGPADEAAVPASELAPGRRVHDYLARVLEAAEDPGARAGHEPDVWDFVSRLTVDGRRIGRDEMFGIGNLLLAGGRDTLVKLISGLGWHLVGSPADRSYLAGHPDAVPAAVAEVVRYLTPLKRMERVLPEDRAHAYCDRDPSSYVLLSFVSANLDRTVWPDADQLDIRRERKPHLGFGFGRHSCMGMKITEHASRAFLAVLLDHWPGWWFDGPQEIRWIREDGVDVVDEFVSIRVRTEEAN